MKFHLNVIAMFQSAESLPLWVGWWIKRE